MGGFDNKLEDITTIETFSSNIMILTKRIVELGIDTNYVTFAYQTFQYSSHMIEVTLMCCTHKFILTSFDKSQGLYFVLV